ncbi:MAG: 3-deoxy-manno-octulosonate cytidylyltransferase [Nitrospirae bacterium]|nr:3-deoxy-manno-octulosonate cytidylyltransferase [Nitrospirota bacterium]MBI5097589.1 3-deoxy-manno-octulosonate cytidylyltransferase [Nitrospirota bacterium]
MHKVAVIIPARYGSSRFPGKVLTPVQSRPLIQWVYEAAARSGLVNRVVVATDDTRIHDAVAGFGGEVMMTSARLRTGSDRCAEVAKKMAEEIIINLQADELLKGPEMLDEISSIMTENPAVLMGTLKRELTSANELWDRNVVKVVTDHEDYALYFSRSPIPHIRDRVLSEEEGLPVKTFFKHLGIYAYKRDFLLLFSALPTTRLEDLEKLEQLRAIESGFRIKVKETGHESYRIDTPEDLKYLEDKALIHEQRKDPH